MAYWVIILFVAGILLGHIIRHKGNWLPTIERATSWIVYALLFLLGVSVGLKREILAKLSTIGYSAELIAVSAILGSILLVYFVFRKWQNK